MRNVRLVEFADILFHAEKMGYGWNQAHKLFDYQSDFCLLPYDGDGARDIYLEDYEPRETDAYKILKSFCETNNIDCFTITR